jgi:thymidylate synthase (FAD)
MEYKFEVLDKGFLYVVDKMGCDDDIVQAARISYGKGTKHTSVNRGLIRYLMRHRHTSPFEMCEIKIHVKMPIFVARQWVRHRTASINEYSARYSILEDEFYIPNASDIALQSADNKQGRGDPISLEEAEKIRESIENAAKKDYALYKDMIDKGIARELARTVLPANIYTQWYWKCDLHNLLNFIELRLHPGAQLEIRKYAQALLEIIKDWVPLTYEAFFDYRLNAIMVSGLEKEFLSRNSKDLSGLGQTETLDFEKNWGK